MKLHNEDKILIHDNMTPKEIEIALNMALFMGFQSVSAKFPIASADEGVHTVTDLKELANMYSIESSICPEGYVSSTKSAVKIPDFDQRKEKGLETLFGEGIFLKDNNNDLLPDSINFKISLPSNCNSSIIIAACNFAFRFGMETTAYDTNIVADDDYTGNLLAFEGYGNCSMVLETVANKKIVHVFGEQKELEDFSAFICEKFPLLPDSNTWSNLLKEITEAFTLSNLDGQLAYTKLAEDKYGEVKAYVEPQIESKKNILKTEFAKTEFHSYKDMKKIYEKEYDIPWEVDVFENILKNNVYPSIKENDSIQILAALSEDKDVRNEIKRKISNELLKLNAKEENTDLICAYKQGISWIEEVILPKIKDLNTGKINIAFKAFLPEGVTDWHDEDGATPSYTNLGSQNADKWYDLPIRFLQELYPIEDIISDELKIDRKNIVFTKYDGNEDITYLFTSFDENGEQVFESSYKVAVSERPYLDEYPMMGKVHPSTGYVKVFINGNCVVDKNILTDVENIWNIYQKDVLSDCREFVENKIDGPITVEHQPFFAQLRLEIMASEPNYKLKSREDLISTLDALHEDMYFVGTDYFKNYSDKLGEGLFDAPGLILPIIEKREGKPKFKVTLFDQMSDKMMVVSNDKVFKDYYEKSQVDAYISQITFENNKLEVCINADSPDTDIIKTYAELMDKQLLSVCDKFKNVSKIKFNTKDGVFETNIIDKNDVIKDLDIRDIDISENILIGYEQYISIIEKLKRVPRLSVYKVANSYQGRDIYAVELSPNQDGYVSKTKRINLLPSELINCRHHANEVSSTNAAFMLLRELLTNEKYNDLADKLNVVIMPVENVDGAAIHYELQKINPNWKFHVARFNSIGKEFFSEHFKDYTIHKEAEAFAYLWKNFLPDIVVDNHGVPSHEWEQQFSGYTSPSFKGFWLPRSLLYGYFWTVTDDGYKSNYILNKAIEDAVAVDIGKNEEITAWNKEWAQRFEKFAHGWMPKLFPANYYKNMINYWIPKKHSLQERYASYKYPWITTAYYTSEVADETAQGDYLNLCARAQLTHNLATINLLTKCQCIYESGIDVTNSKVSVSYIRQRPIIV